MLLLFFLPGLPAITQMNATERVAMHTQLLLERVTRRVREEEESENTTKEEEAGSEECKYSRHCGSPRMCSSGVKLKGGVL